MVQLAGALDTVMEVGTRLVEGGEHATFELRAGPLSSSDLTVISFTGSEAISELFSFNVICWTDLESPVLTQMLLGQPATFSMEVRDGAPRVVHGIVSSVEAQGVARSDHRRQYRIRVVPRMWLLKKRTNSRIFQEKTPQEIVSEVLAQAGIAYRWNLTEKYPVRTYCVQYRETDYHFVKRLLAEEGVWFHFEPPAQLLESVADALGGTVLGAVGAAVGEMAGLTETIVFSDSADSYPPIQQSGGAGSVVGAAVDALGVGSSGIFSTARELRGAATAPVVPFRSAEGMHPGSEAIDTLTVRETVKSRATHLRDYDFRHPTLSLNAKAVAGTISSLRAESLASLGSLRTTALGAATEAVAAVLGDCTPLEVYTHHGQYEEPEVQRAIAHRHLEQLRVRADLAMGRSNCRRLFPGGRFRLDGHVELDRDYAITKVTHEGIIPEYHGERARDLQTYRNRFECVPAAAAYRPTPATSDLQQVLESAVVVGPANEEIHTDEHGRIKVQFHWDREGRRNEHSSCWIRVSQMWAGPGWGTQFIPRIGMEVLVSFIGGDEDRPVVVGCVANQVNPVPFRLPEHKTRSGIRTQSTPRGGGFNELSFEDRAGQELVYLRAQLDSLEEILRDRTARVDRDDVTEVARDQREHVGGDRDDRVERKENSYVGGDAERRVQGRSLTVVGGNAQKEFSRELTTRIGGTERRDVAKDAYLNVDGSSISKVKGHYALLVGRDDARRSATVHVSGSARIFATDLCEIEARKGLVVRCGKTSFRFTENALEIAGEHVAIRGKNVMLTGESVAIRGKKEASVTSDTITLQSRAARVVLDQNAAISGMNVALSATPTSETGAPQTPPQQITTVELKDSAGKPLANEFYVVKHPDGSETSGYLDEQGRADLDGDISGKVTLPYHVETKK